MPGWAERVPGFRREGEQVFEEHLRGADGEQHWVRVSLGPVAERGEERAMAYLLFVNKPDVDTIDHDEVRRLRKSLQLLADTQTDYVVEVDRAGVMTFVSPSFCRAVGAQEGELVGHEFLTRVCEDDRVAVTAALEEAGKPPFIGKMRARLAADPRADLDWQIDAVIGEGIVGLDLVGRVAGDRRPATPAPELAASSSAAAAALCRGDQRRPSPHRDPRAARGARPGRSAELHGARARRRGRGRRRVHALQRAARRRDRAGGGLAPAADRLTRHQLRRA